ncbi:MAG: BatA domain-containing protein [Gemmatimonadetes bacterium]|nr:BatA domain-containing protein [Gemmatimonadota bacterium]
MGLLNPLLLLAGAAIVVPLILHLFHRHDTKRVAFPALRYLQRAEKEHARTIRLRQILLLVLRITAILLLALAAARPFVGGGGGIHDPTALVIILDNSMSSGRVVGQGRTLDQLKGIARKSVARASSEDRVWLLRAGEPWSVALTGPLDDVGRWIEETVVSGGRGNLLESIERAAALVSGAGLRAAEIHVVSDLQRTAFLAGTVRADLTAIPLIVYDGTDAEPVNRHLDGLLIGGGLPPLANQRSQITVRVSGGSDSLAPIRLVIENRIRGAASAPEGIHTLLPLGPFAEGPVSGYVETDPDDLGLDDRQYFSLTVRPPPGVWADTSQSFFLSRALPVLESAGLLRPAPVTEADVLLAIGGAGMESRRTGAAAIVVPYRDVTLLPALNRRLASSGIPWRFEPTEDQGETPLGASSVPISLDGVRVFEHYRLIPGSTGGADGAEAQTEVVVRLATGEPWLVRGTSGRGPFFLVASPLEPEATNLPITASLLPLLEWMLSGWAGDRASIPFLIAGEPIPLPEGATGVQDPEGTLHPVDGTGVLRETRLPGVYTIYEEDAPIAYVALNTPIEESLLERIEARELRGLVDAPLTMVEDSTRWTHAVFASGQGPEVWWQVLIMALGVLVLESLVAASGPARVRGGSMTSASAHGGAGSGQ